MNRGVNALTAKSKPEATRLYAKITLSGQGVCVTILIRVMADMNAKKDGGPWCTCGNLHEIGQAERVCARPQTVFTSCHWLNQI